MAVDPIMASLRRRRITLVCHMTSCHNLPGIIRGGGLMSFNRRQQLGIDEDDEPHYWGSVGKKEALADYVVCAFMPPWWMCRRRTEELAMILLDAEAVCGRPGTSFCPTNSARNDYSADQIISRTGIGPFDECFQNPDTYMAGDAELFVRDFVPLRDFRALVFKDKESADYWVPLVNQAYRDAPDPKPQAPEDGLKVVVGGYPRFNFPGDWVPSRRIRA